MKKGFTLVELLGVIVILGILSLIVFPIVLNQLKGSKESVNKATENLLFTAFDLYLEENPNRYGYYQNDTYCVTLQNLVENDKLKKPLLNANGKELDYGMYIEGKVVVGKELAYRLVKDCSETNQKPDIPDEPIVPPNSDVTPPTITIISENKIPHVVTIFDSMEGVIIQDDVSPMNEIKVEISGTVSLGIVGDYVLTYKATDQAGNYTIVKRTITIYKAEYVFDYTGNAQTFTVPLKGTYKFELWGAQGGNTVYNASSSTYGGRGAYVYGEISLDEHDTLYIYVGSQGNGLTGGYNGGGDAYSLNQVTSGGGGATDIRLVGGSWNDTTGLRSRIMVAAGGGGSGYYLVSGTTFDDGYGGDGGTLLGINGNGRTYNTKFAGTGGSQISGGYQVENNAYTAGFGIGGYGKNNMTCCGTSGGGGGYYGGGSSTRGHCSGGGGSSYISGHPGSIAILSESNATPKVTVYTQLPDSYHYSGYRFTSTTMKAGNEVMPTFDGAGTMIGKSGNGYAKITLVE